MLFDRICVENGIRHLLTAPYSPTTTGKVERLHKTMRTEFFDLHVREWATVEAAQVALDAWVLEYNTARPHRSCGGRVPAERFRLDAEPVRPADAHDETIAVTADVAADDSDAAEGGPTRLSSPRPAGVSRWVDQTGAIRLAGAVYRVGSAFAGCQVEVVCRGGLVEIVHAGVLITTHVQRRRTSTQEPGQLPRRATARHPTAGLTVTRIADGAGAVSFAGTAYHAGRAWRRRSIEVAIVAGSVQLSSGGKVIRVHPIRHDRTKEHGAFAVPAGRHRRTTPTPKPDTATG